jgi:hypothetical protein
VLSAHTSEVVCAAIVRLQLSDPAKQQLTLEEVAEALEPEQVAMLRIGHVQCLAWMESLSNTIKQLGRDGTLMVDVITDNRGYASPVVRL